jgi:hypothetical protein
MFVVALERMILYLVVDSLPGTCALLRANTIGRGFDRVPGYHDLGGHREENAFLPKSES